MHNIVALLEPSEENWNNNVKAGKMYLNRFLINEDAACELSGVYYLKESPYSANWLQKTDKKFRFDRNFKGKRHF